LIFERTKELVAFVLIVYRNIRESFVFSRKREREREKREKKEREREKKERKHYLTLQFVDL